MQISPTPSTSSLTAPVSVIIPCYCCADTVARAVDSVMAQTLLPSELWLVDDASPDGGKTQAALGALHDKYSSIIRVEVIMLSVNGGPSAARNAAWERATQPYLAFLDADDAWHPRKVEIQYGWMARHPSVMLTGHAVDRVDDDSQLPAASKIAEFRNAWQVSPHRLLWANYFPTRSVMLWRELPTRFEPAKRRSEDYLLWLQTSFGGHPLWRLELPLARSFKAAYGEAGLTEDLWDMEKGELDTFRRLYKQGYFGRGLLFGVTIFSLIKFTRRWLVCLTRRRN